MYVAHGSVSVTVTRGCSRWTLGNEARWWRWSSGRPVCWLLLVAFGRQWSPSSVQHTWLLSECLDCKC